jgi:hypothetical protein
MSEKESAERVILANFKYRPLKDMALIELEGNHKEVENMLEMLTYRYNFMNELEKMLRKIRIEIQTEMSERSAN